MWVPKRLRAESRDVFHTRTNCRVRATVRENTDRMSKMARQ
jgi:hypothetical protein